MPGASGLELLSRLTDKKATYPIIACFGYREEYHIREYANRGLNVIFLAKPWSPSQLAEIIVTRFGFSPEGVGGVASQPREVRPPRIVVVDDEETTLMLYETIMRRFFRNAAFRAFQNRDEAWQELLRSDPDLLITDMNNDNVPGRTQYLGMSGWKMLPLLATRWKAKASPR